MLRAQDPPSVREDAHRVARAAFSKGMLCLRITDALGPVYQDRPFAALFPGPWPARGGTGPTGVGRCQSTQAGRNLSTYVVLHFEQHASGLAQEGPVRSAGWPAGVGRRSRRPLGLPNGSQVA